MTESEKLILEFHVLTSEINDLKKQNSERVGDCLDYREDKDLPVCAITCLEEAFNIRKSSLGFEGSFDDLCSNCESILMNCTERKHLNIQRGYVKNKMHNLAKRLLKSGEAK